MNIIKKDKTSNRKLFSFQINEEEQYKIQEIKNKKINLSEMLRQYIDEIYKECIINEK